MNIVKSFEIWEEEAHEKIEMFFQEVLSMIARQKDKYYQIIDLKKEKTEEQLNNEEAYLQEQTISISQMREDI